MADSSQKFIARNRAPRVQIEYDVELYGAEKKVQLPFVMGVMSDLSGKSTVETPSIADRKFLEIDVDNFDDRMKAMAPRVEFSVPNTLTGEGNLAVDLTFEKMSDFSPAQIASKIEPLRKLLEARTQLSTLMAYMDGKTGAETLIEKVLADPALLGAIAGSSVPEQDSEATLDALRDMAPEDTPQDQSVENALASLPEVEADVEQDNAGDVLSELAANAPAGDKKDTSVADALSSLPEVETQEEVDSSGDILTELAHAAPAAEIEDTATQDILSSVPTVEEVEDPDVVGDVLSELADAAPDELAEDTSVADALLSVPEIEIPDVSDRADDVLSDLADAEPAEIPEDTSVVDALSSIPEAEVAEDQNDSEDILSDLAEAAPNEEATDASLSAALASVPEIENAPEGDQSDDILSDLADLELEETEESGALDEALSSLPDAAEEVHEDHSDVLSDLADAAPPDDADETDLDDLLGDLADMAPDEADETSAEDVLASVPELDDAAELDVSDGVLSELAASEPQEQTDGETDLDDLLGDLAASDVEAEPEEDTLDDVLGDLADTSLDASENDETELEDVLADLTEDSDNDLDDLLNELDADNDEASSSDDEATDDLDDLLNELESDDEDASAVDDDTADDLDDLLTELEVDQDEASTSDDETTDDLDDVLNELGSDDTDADDDTADDLDDLLSDLGSDDEDAPTSDGDTADDLDDLLADLDSDDEAGGDDLDELLGDIEADEATAEPAEAAEMDGAPQLAFGRMSADRPDPERLKRTRFRIAIFGDFSGRSARGQVETGDALAARKPIILDSDTVEDVIESFATTLVLPIGKDGAGIEVQLKGLDDLHPDELYEKVELFDGLSGLKSQLSAGATADHAAKQLIGWGEEFGQAVVPPRKSSGGNTVRADLKLSDFQKLIGDTGGALAQASPVDDLLKRVVGPHIRKLPSPDVQAMQTAVDEALSAAMRMVLHHPEFQSVEAQWRSLDLIARSVEDDDTLDVVLYDVSAEEIAADLAAEEDLAKTGLVRLLTDEPLDEENGRGGYSAMIGLYTFEETPPHAELLGRIGRVAAHVDAPFISAITPAYLDVKKEDRHPLVVEAWDTLRAMPEAGHIGLASPRFLLRRPYGAKSEPIYEFDFEEFTETEGLRGMLWANPAVLVTILLAQSFKQHGKGMKLGSVMSLGGMPYHFVNDRHGDQVALPCTERNITLAKHEHSVQRGYMPVLSVKGRDEIRLGSFNSVAGQEILGPWSGVPVPEPSPDVPPAPKVAEETQDDLDLDLDLDAGDDDDFDLDDLDLDLDDDDSSDLDDLLASFGDDDDDDDDGDADDEMDPELAALLDDL